MDQVGLKATLSNTLQAVASQTQTQERYALAVAKAVQDVQKQQAAAAVQLIESASDILVDVRV